jgi:LPXTG-site transpeptidase (sortase) family protein
MTKKTHGGVLFLSTFVSTLLLIFGVSTLGAMFIPALAQLADPIDYRPELPLAGLREEEFVDVTTIPAAQRYPQLSQDSLSEEARQYGGKFPAGNWIRIPSIGVNVPMVQAVSIADNDVLATLDQGAALYPNGIEPGRLGNTFISAHSTGEPWKGKYRFAFLRINEIEPGNIIHLDYEGTRYTYKVTHTNIVKPDPNFRVESGRPVPTMALMACWPLWSTDKRMIKHAELTNVTQLTSPAQLALAI